MKIEIRDVHDNSFNELAGISKLIESINQVPYQDIIDGFKVKHGYKEGVSGYRHNYDITEHFVSLDRADICFEYIFVQRSEDGDLGDFIIKGLGPDPVQYNIYSISWISISDFRTRLNIGEDNQIVTRRILGDKITDLGLISKWDELIQQVKDELDKRFREVGIVVAYPKEDGLKAISNICRDLLSEEGKTHVEEHEVREDVSSLMNTYIEVK